VTHSRSVRRLPSDGDNNPHSLEAHTRAYGIIADLQPTFSALTAVRNCMDWETESGLEIEVMTEPDLRYCGHRVLAARAGSRQRSDGWADGYVRSPRGDAGMHARAAEHARGVLQGCMRVACARMLRCVVGAPV